MLWVHTLLFSMNMMFISIILIYRQVKKVTTAPVMYSISVITVTFPEKQGKTLLLSDIQTIQHIYITDYSSAHKMNGTLCS